MYEYLNQGLGLLRQYIPVQYAYAPHAACGLIALSSLYVLWRGARLIPIISTVAFIGVGLVSGHQIALHFSLPLWPITALGGAVGLALGAMLVKLWLALLLAVCFATISLGIYSFKVVGPHFEDFRQGEDFNTDPQFVIPSTSGEAPSAGDPQQFWQYLQEHVPQVQLSIGAVLLSGALAGLVIGLALPKTSRAIAAATSGSITLAAALYGGAYFFRQDEMVRSWGWYPLAGLGAVWLISLGMNMADQRIAKSKKPAAKEPDEAESATA
jgi:hypothetical protein